MLLADKIAGRNTTMAIQQKPSTHPRVSITLTSAIRIVVLHFLIIFVHFRLLFQHKKKATKKPKKATKRKTVSTDNGVDTIREEVLNVSKKKARTQDKNDPSLMKSLMERKDGYAKMAIGETNACRHCNLTELDQLDVFKKFYCDTGRYLHNRCCVYDDACKKGPFCVKTWNKDIQGNRVYFCNSGARGWNMEVDNDEDQKMKDSYTCDFVICAGCYQTKIAESGNGISSRRTR